MTVGLMAYVPYNAVFWSGKNIVKCNRQLYHSKARSQMTRIYRELFHYSLAKLVTYLGKLIYRQLTQVGRVVYVV